MKNLKEISVIALAANCLLLFSGTALSRPQLPATGKPHHAALSTAEARKLFQATCAGCHGLDGKGGERGPDIASRQEVLRLQDREILKILRNGISTAGMPSFAALGPEKLSGLLDYLRVLQGKDASAALPGDPQLGKIIFYGKARCSECHMVRGAGGFIGSDLSSFGAGLAPSEIQHAITEFGKDPAQLRSGIAVALSSGQTVQGIIRNEDNFSLQVQSADGVYHLLKKSEIAKTEILTPPLMPTDYASTLTAGELHQLVAYLMSVSREGNRPAEKPEWDEDE